jgi:hypothetical protein
LENIYFFAKNVILGHLFKFFGAVVDIIKIERSDLSDLKSD